jgi:hypothetical protein
MTLEKARKLDEQYVNSLPYKLSFLLSGQKTFVRSIKQLTSHLLSPLQAMPRLDWHNDIWSMKQSGLLLQQLLLAATAYSLASATMEGFDERRLCYQLQIPLEQYRIPAVIALGYSEEIENSDVNNNNNNNSPCDNSSNNNLENEKDHSLNRNSDDSVDDLEHQRALQRRFPLQQLCYEEEYGLPLRTL